MSLYTIKKVSRGTESILLCTRQRQKGMPCRSIMNSIRGIEHKDSFVFFKLRTFFFQTTKNTTDAPQDTFVTIFITENFIHGSTHKHIHVLVFETTKPISNQL